VPFGRLDQPMPLGELGGTLRVEHLEARELPTSTGIVLSCPRGHAPSATPCASAATTGSRPSSRPSRGTRSSPT